jgi:hypothetical protein
MTDTKPDHKCRKLLAALEKAEGPDRELDAQIVQLSFITIILIWIHHP